MNSNFLIIAAAQYLIFLLAMIWAALVLRQVLRKKWEIVILIIMALPLAYLVAKLASLIYFDPRPFAAGNFIPLIPHAADNGFPSDHTLLGAAMAATIYSYKRVWGILLFFLTVLVGMARVMAGIHHSQDIACSLVIAVLVTWFCYQILLPLLKSKLPAKLTNYLKS